jgi:hypothetical protein
MIRGSPDIEECSRPSAAGIVETSILDIPGRHAGVAQAVRQRGGILQRRESLHPAPAVDHDDDRKGALARRQAQLSELQWNVPIRDSHVGRPRGQRIDVTRTQPRRLCREGGSERDPDE